MRLIPALAAATALLLLSGCAATASGSHATSQPVTDISSQPTPSSTPATPAWVEVSATGLTIQDAQGAAIETDPYTGDATKVIGSLDALFGAHETMQSCSGAVWGQMDETVFLHPSAAGGFDIIVKSAHLGTVGIRSSAGFAVGDDITAVLAGLPAAQIDANLSQAVWQTAGGDPTKGAVVVFDDAKHVTLMHAPATPSSTDYCD